MATVRITKELTETLVRIGSAPFRNQYTTTKDSANFDHHADGVWRALWGEHAATVMALPDYAFPRRHCLSVRVGGDPVDIVLTLPETRPIPFKLPDNDLVKQAWGDVIFIDKHLHWADLHREVMEWQTQLKRITLQRKSFEDNLYKLLGTYSTLAPALRAWPPLWDLLPDEVKAKHKEVNLRKKEQVTLDGIDLGSMTAVITVRKLTGSI